MSDLGNKEVFSKNLRHYMEKSGKSRSDISKDLGFAYSTFSAWCNGDIYPRIDKIEMIANYFNIQKSDLIENKHKEDYQIDEYAILFNKFKELSDKDKELITNIIETRKRQIDEELDN